MMISKGIRSKVLRIILYGVCFFCAIFLLLEIFLRIYDPFKFRLKSNRIILPANQTRVITNDINPTLDSIIYNTRNSLGMRGPDTAAGFSNQLSIITVGGSATACHFIDDKKTWPFLLGERLKKDFPNVWINNAGLDGHSTRGHLLLLNDYLVKLRPKVIIFLTGSNDIENDGPTFFEKLHTRNSYPDLLNYVYNNSEVVSDVINLSRGGRVQKISNTTQVWKKPGAIGELTMTTEQMNSRLQKQQKYLEGYGARLSQLADDCIRNNIKPIFLTQPNLYGRGIDSVTGANLESAKVEENMNGELLEALLGVYNAKVKEVCEAKKVPCIDLASQMPKNGLYYYDQTHFTNEGAGIVAQIVEQKLKEILGTH